MAKKAKAKPKTKIVSDENSFSIPAEDPILKFDIDGIELKAAVSTFHRLVKIAQHNAMVDRNEVEDYFPEFATLLSNKFESQINETVAYRIADIVFNKFYEEKKS